MKQQFDPYVFEKLEVNGVPVFYKNLPWVNDCVHIRVIMRVGARHDPEGKEGLAHFFEHLPFDGCEEYASFETIQQFRRDGFMNTLGAYTGFDTTVYHGTVLPENLRSALRFLKVFVFKPLLLPAEVERERKVITREFWDRHQNKVAAEFSLKCHQDLFLGHPLGKAESALGHAETIAALVPEDLMAFHAHRYVRENTILILTGGVSRDSVHRETETWVAGLPSGERVSDATHPNAWPAPRVPGRSISYTDDFGMNADACPKRTDIFLARVFPAQGANEGAAQLLSQVARQAIFEEIRGKGGGTYSPHIMSWLYPDLYMARLRLSVQPENEESAKRTCGKIMGRLSVGDKDLKPLFESIKKAALERLRAIDENGDEITDAAVEHLRLYGKIKPLAECITDYTAVEYGHVCTLAQKEFAAERVHFRIIRP